MFVHITRKKGFFMYDGVLYKKFRLASNIDDIVKATRDVRNEPNGNYGKPGKHNKFPSYNHGTVDFMIDDEGYTADAVYAINVNNEEMIYDIVDITPKKITPSTSVIRDLVPHSPHNSGGHTEDKDVENTVPHSSANSNGKKPLQISFEGDTEIPEEYM